MKEYKVLTEMKGNEKRNMIKVKNHPFSSFCVNIEHFMI